MTLSLQHNRYNSVVPTVILESGLCISVPFYISLLPEHRKILLNKFREIKTQQLIDAGFNPQTRSGNLVVQTAEAPPQTPIELELGMNEDNLRSALFNRQGIQERLVIKLQHLTGVTLVSKKDVEETYKLWLTHLFDENKGSTRTTKATNKSNKTKSTAKATV